MNLCPKPDGYGSAEERASYSAYGRETWWYNCNTPSYPYVSYHLDDTLTSAVMVGWMMADYDLTGDLYWAVNYHYAEGANLEDPYSTAHRGSGANGDGFLVYPGKTYGLDEPVASIRLDAIRDGREDYELIKILKDLYGAKGYSADPVIGMMTSKLYSDSSVLGGSAEYEAAREILLSLVETATSSATFMITSLERTETAQGTSFTIQAIAAPDAKLYAGDAQLLPENGVYTVTKSLTEQENYYAVRIVAADGTEHALSLYLGGKEQVFLAETFAEGDFGGDILSREFSEEGYLKLTLGNDAGTGGKLSFDLLHESIGEISASTANYTIELYNEQDEADHVARAILEGVAAGRKFSDYAILYRMNSQSNTFERAFVKAGIPYRIIGGTRFYERKEIRDMILFEYHDCSNQNSLPSLDFVVCRDVLSFMEAKKQSAVIADIAENLKGNGLVLLGMNESMPKNTGWQRKEKGKTPVFVKE